MQMPHWMQAEFRLSNASPRRAKAMTSTPTWQCREHCVQEMHLSFDAICSRPNHFASTPFHAASGHQ